MGAASCSEPAGRNTPCSKKFIFKRQKRDQLERAEPHNRTPTTKIKRILTSQTFFSSLQDPSGRHSRESLGGGAVLLELAGDVFNGRQWAKDMNFFVRRVDVNLQFSVMSANLNVLIVVDYFYEIGVGIFFQLLDDGVKNRQRFARVVVYVAPVFVWH
jgi:hypothetical protein